MNYTTEPEWYKQFSTTLLSLRSYQLSFYSAYKFTSIKGPTHISKEHLCFLILMLGIDITMILLLCLCTCIPFFELVIWMPNMTCIIFCLFQDERSLPRYQVLVYRYGIFSSPDNFSLIIWFLIFNILRLEHLSDTNSNEWDKKKHFQSVLGSKHSSNVISSIHLETHKLTYYFEATF
jgi:hypothetical protein